MKTIIGVGSTFANVGATDIIERSHDGRVIEVLLPDKSKVYGYKLYTF